MSPRLAGSLLCLAALALLVGAVRSSRQELSTPVALGEVSYVGSTSCLACHADHTRSWRQTFHRTMTQEATSATVLGAFDGSSLTADGVTSRFFRDGDRFFIDTLDGEGRQRPQEIVRTVGSRRVQQYVTRDGDRFVRLPLAWNIEERRWFQLNVGFLDPDGVPFNSHRALWDGNCIFCHNVKAQPGYDWERARFDSHVAELGIACEACHGPGAAHVERNRNPVRRYLLHLTGAGDPTIVNPTRLPPLQRLQICGHCHGQRLPHPIDRIREFMSKGDPFTPGDDLDRYTEPLQRGSELPGVDVTQRFWKDGTPRLTAYEYQGLRMSKDFQKGGLTCEHCHSLHGGDPRGMITKAMRGPEACAACHAKIVANPSAHSHHAQGSSGNDCYACHLPKITYGLMEVHPTHRIQVPDPSRAWRYQMPEACTLCHTDRTAIWAAKALAAQEGALVALDLPTDPQFAVAEDVRALLAGDVVQRSVAAMALGDERSASPDPRARLWAAPFLMISMEDSYPSVRHFAYRSLRALVTRAREAGTDAIPWFDPQAPEAARREVIAQWRAWWSALDKHTLTRPDGSVPIDANFQPSPDVVEALLHQRASQPAVSIGE